MDFCILPSRREGFGLAILEAAALGKPSGATRVTGCVDAMVDGQTGLLFEPNDLGALTAAMARLADDPALRAQLGAAAYRRVREHFDSTRLVEEHLRLYRRMLGENQGES
ncbi:MAG: glycosyltransferase [Planctomycetota bacterium]